MNSSVHDTYNALLKAAVTISLILEKKFVAITLHRRSTPLESNGILILSEKCAEQISVQQLETLFPEFPAKSI